MVTKRRPPPFFDRKQEIDDISAALKSARSELRIVYGRRGAGKSTLFEHVFDGREHFSYTCTQRVLALQVEDIRRALVDFAPGALVGNIATFNDFLSALSALATRAKKPLVVVIDEFPYLARAESGVLTDLQRWFNEQKRARVRNLKLFLLGSMVSWMQEQALSDTAALKSVRTGQLAVHPLEYRHAVGFYPKWSATDKVRAFGIWGGLPGVLAEISSARSLFANLETTTLTRGAKLYDEPDWLQYTDLRGNAIHSSIVRAVAEGARKATDIARAVRAKSDIQPYLDKLLEAQILERRTPLLPTGERPKTSLYYVSDQFLAYWYRFVNPERSALERGQRARPLQRIKEGLDKYISEDAFERIARAYLWEALIDKRLPRGLQLDRVGSWWTARGDQQDQADVVAYAGRELALIGECKWTNTMANEDDLRGLDKILRDFGTELNPSRKVWRALFSRSGFSEGLKRSAAKPTERILLLEPSDLYW